MLMRLLSIATISIMLVACGGSSTTSDADTSTKKETTQDKPTTDAGSVTLELGSNDQMKFDKAELKVKAGQKVTLKLTHTGTMAKEAMGHNFVLLKKGVDIASFAGKAIAAAGSEYIPEGDEVIAHTGVIGGGESTSVTFTAPAAGTYDFICSFPGHYALMQGKFIVE